MRALRVLGAACIMVSVAVPAFADGMSMMKGGEVIAVMPDGHMGTMMMTDAKMAAETMKMAKPLDHCVMMMTGADGKMFMVDTMGADGKKECEKIAK